MLDLQYSVFLVVVFLAEAVAGLLGYVYQASNRVPAVNNI